MYSISVLFGGNYDAVTQNQIEEMCEASLMFTGFPKLVRIDVYLACKIRGLRKHLSASLLLCYA